jgi:hypothetical protein
VTFIERDFPDEAAAREAARLLRERLKATGEWRIGPHRGKWRLAAACEVDLTDHQRSLLGGEEAAGPTAEGAPGDRERAGAGDVGADAAADGDAP